MFSPLRLTRTLHIIQLCRLSFLWKCLITCVPPSLASIRNKVHKALTVPKRSLKLKSSAVCLMKKTSESLPVDAPCQNGRDSWLWVFSQTTYTKPFLCPPCHPAVGTSAAPVPSLPLLPFSFVLYPLIYSSLFSRNTNLFLRWKWNQIAVGVFLQRPYRTAGSLHYSVVPVSSVLYNSFLDWLNVRQLHSYTLLQLPSLESWPFYLLLSDWLHLMPSIRGVVKHHYFWVCLLSFRTTSFRFFHIVARISFYFSVE